MDKEIKTLLSSAAPITRKWFWEKVKNDPQIMDETIALFQRLNRTEKKIYAEWHKNCLEEMRRTKLHVSVADLYNIITDPAVSVKKALTISRRYYVRQDKSDRKKQIGKMISLLQRLEKRESSFYKDAFLALHDAEHEDTLTATAARYETLSRRDEEDLLYTKQSIKHVNNLWKIGAKPSVHELYQALEPRFANDYDLFQKQISVVLKTFESGHDVPADIKNVCFDFIRDSISYAGYAPAQLIAYIFLNDEISEKAFALLCGLKETIYQQGMSVLVKSSATRLAARLKLDDKPRVDLTESDLRILKLAELFA